MRVRIDLMWQRLSFRTQLFLPLGVSFVAALIMGGVLLLAFATGQLADENEPGRRATRTLAAARNNTRRTTPHPPTTPATDVHNRHTATVDEHVTVVLGRDSHHRHTESQPKHSE